jgi:phosphatidylserine/phosphatidylglycerophosphate/cardiolipin synthase-like enzyme/uncharacterized membrane protein YdjX (TVP38/TMEM64 family)
MAIVEGESCWQRAHARRVSVLLDAAEYFGRLREAFWKAKHSILIAGWDVDSRCPLVGPEGAPEDGAPAALRPFLAEMVRRRPELQVRILLWDYAILYALEREAFPRLNLGWRTPEQVRVCLDDVLPLGASHHQKVVVVDDSLAFCGGLDLTIRRWDVSAHPLDHPHRRDPAGQPYEPFHDVQAVVDGEAARALSRLFRERWERTACGEIPAMRPEEDGADLWPDDLVPDFVGLDLAISRTMPSVYGDPEVREIERLYLDLISVAERTIYIENQFLSSLTIAKAIARRMEERPRLECLIVSQQRCKGRMEELTMGRGRARFMHVLREPIEQGRLSLVYPLSREGGREAAVKLHAKLMIVDDRYLVVGSANLSNRSMGFDSECNLIVEARRTEDRLAVRRILARLLADHTGRALNRVEAALVEGSLVSVPGALSRQERALEPIEPSEDTEQLEREVRELATRLGDPERPAPQDEVLGDMFGAYTRSGGRWRLIALVSVVALIVALIAAWRFTALSEWARPSRVQQLFDAIREGPAAPVAVLVVFLVGGLIGFPVTVLITFTGLTFGPLLGFVYAMLGSLASAAALFGIGSAVGGRVLRNWMGPRVERVSRGIAKQGVLAVAALRVVPVAPYTVINLVAGATHVRFFDFMAGTFLGMFPGILVLTALGDQLQDLWQRPTLANVGAALGLVAVYALVSWGIQRLVVRRRG